MEETQYLELMREVLHNGVDKPSRTGVGTRFVSGVQLKFNLTKPDGSMILPLLTTKKVSFKLVYSELLWLLSASCDSSVLAEQYDNHIWDADGSRESLDKRGFKYRKVGELGPVYGWQWRNWNKPYPVSDSSETGVDRQWQLIKDDEITSGSTNFYFARSVMPLVTSVIYNDQITHVIENLKKDPWSRRHIVTAWNPDQIDQMALPPCHVMFQFIVRPNHRPSSYYNVDDPKKRLELSIKDGLENPQPYWLDCILTQRSGDIPLGIPFNIASYSLLTHMIAHLTGLKAGQLIHNIGDAHIYHNQIEGCLTQIDRKPRDPPTISILDMVPTYQSIDDFNIDSITLKDYNPDPAIKFPLST